MQISGAETNYIVFVNQFCIVLIKLHESLNIQSWWEFDNYSRSICLWSWFVYKLIHSTVAEALCSIPCTSVECGCWPCWVYARVSSCLFVCCCFFDNFLSYPYTYSQGHNSHIFKTQFDRPIGVPAWLNEDLCSKTDFEI